MLWLLRCDTLFLVVATVCFFPVDLLLTLCFLAVVSFTFTSINLIFFFFAVLFPCNPCVFVPDFFVYSFVCLCLAFALVLFCNCGPTEHIETLATCSSCFLVQVFGP